jgi:hypothetical protein
LTPNSFGELMQFAELISKSDLAGKDYKGKPGNCIVAIQLGASVGLSPLQALQGIAVINGKPSLYGDALLAVVRASPECEDVVERMEAGIAMCTVKRRGCQPVSRSFGEMEARKAGLWGKQGPWTQYPQRMLQMRARAFACRDAFADVLMGLQSAEEVQDYDVKATIVDKAPTAALPAANKPASVPPPAAEEPAPTNTAACKFAWKASDEWNGKPLIEAPTDVLIEYSDYLGAVMHQHKGKPAAKQAGKFLTEAEAEIALRLEAEAKGARKALDERRASVDVGAGLQDIVDERDDKAEGSWLDPEAV